MGSGKIYRVSKLSILLVLLLIPTFAFSQEEFRRPSRQVAFDAFSRGDYEKAYLEFDGLSRNYSKDPVYKYYKGVCLVKLGRNAGKAGEYLSDALDDAHEIKSVPDDAWFYLGRAQQMSGKFTEALKSYSVYEKKAGKKKARSMKLSVYVQESKEGRGKIDSREEFEENLADSNHDLAGSELKAEKIVPVIEAIPDDFDKVLTEAMDYQIKADSITAIANESKNRLGKLPADQQKNEKTRIAEMEAQAKDYQKLADNKFNVTEQADNQDKTEARVAMKEDKSPPREALSRFKLETNPALVAKQKIDFDPQLPEGLAYRIQVGVFSRPVDVTFFKGLTPVAGFSIPGSDAKRYFVGLFRQMPDASNALNVIRQAGFKDAFITAIMDGKQVSAERAAILEKEWGQKELFPAAPQKPVEPSYFTLVYRVELLKTPKPLPASQAETYRNMAGDKGFDEINSDDGSFVYLIGKFITFESASDYAGLLNRNGYREARVAAYLGNKEIPLDTARQLFDSQK